MRRELTEFSDQIDEQFDTASNNSFELWAIILNWFGF